MLLARCRGFVAAFLLVGTTAASADEEWPGESSEWSGFTRHDFEFEGAKAIVVRPTQELSGRPWIWRARFFGHEPQTDLALLERGFHLAYVDVAGLYGNDVAVERWRRFHDHLVTKHGFAPKTVIEAMSRGGLIALNFARAWPEHVAAMYLDNPVCDIRSWPGGRGEGKGSPGDWARCLRAYGLDEVQAEAFDGPLADVEPIVRHKIGLLAVVGTADHVVPIDENIRPFVRAIETHGGHCELIEKDGVDHHPHSLKDPTPIVNFALHHGVRPDSYIELRRGLPQFRMAMQRGEVRVAFLGGSITAMNGWRNLIQTYLAELAPHIKWDFVDAGIPSLDSSAHAFRLQQDVLDGSWPDLVFVEAAVNDLHNGRTPEEQTRGMEGVIRHLRRNQAKTDVVMMHFIDPSMFALFDRDEIPPTVAHHEAVAEHYDVASINLAREVHDRIRVGQFTWKDDFKNLHPSPFGHRLYANSIIRLFELATSTEVTLAKLPEPMDAQCYDHGDMIPAMVAHGGVENGDLRASLRGDFTLIQDWRPTDGAGTRAGFVGVPVVAADRPGSTLEFRFTGRAIGIFHTAGPDAGTIEVRIDDGEPQEVDLFTKWSGGLHLPWVHVFGADLTPGPHTLHLEIVENRNPRSKGHAVRIVHFLVNQ